LASVKKTGTNRYRHRVSLKCPPNFGETINARVAASVTMGECITSIPEPQDIWFPPTATTLGTKWILAQ